MMKMERHACFIERWVLFFLGMAMVASLAVTMRGVFQAHAYLPSDDLLWYGDWLYRVIHGEADWQLLWKAHNGVHQAALLKLVCVLDVWLARGSGWLVVGTSAMCLLAAYALVLHRVLQIQGWDRIDKSLFACFVGVYALGAAQLNTLLSPASLWSPMVLCLVITGLGLQAWLNGRRSGLLWLCAGVLGSVLSAAPVVIVFVALLLAGIFGLRKQHPVRYWLSRVLMFALLAILLTYVMHELLNRFIWQGTPLLYRLTWHLLDDEFQPIIEQMAQGDVWGYQWRWLWQSFLSMAYFWTVPFNVFLPMYVWLPALIGLFFIVMLFFRRHGFPDALRGFLLYGLLFIFGFSLASSLFRGWMDVGSTRFSSVSLFGQGLLWVFLFFCLKERLPRPLLAMALLCLAVLALCGHALSAAHFVESRNAHRIAQVVYSVGSEDDMALITSGMLPTATRDIQAVRAFVPLWQSASLGVFSSEGYRIFMGEKPLPEREVVCQHELVFARSYRGDDQALRIRARTVTDQGSVADRVVIRSVEGIAVGYGIPWMPEGFIAQWMGDRDWFAYLRFPERTEAAVSVIAYGRSFRCQPWLLSLQ